MSTNTSIIFHFLLELISVSLVVQLAVVEDQMGICEELAVVPVIHLVQFVLHCSQVHWFLDDAVVIWGLKFGL
jgi:hypothetical protein